MPAPLFSNVRAIYLDLDDTLCAYWDASKVGLRQAFEKHPVEDLTADEMVRHWAAAFREFSKGIKESPVYDEYLTSGRPTRTEQMRRTLARAGVTSEEHAQALSEAYMTGRDSALKLFPESIPFLEAVFERYPLGLITNGPADIQRQEIATLGIEKYFANIFIEGEMREGKPLQSVFQRATKAVGKEPEQILMVGNSFGHDIAPAIIAGWRTAWVRRPSDVAPSTTPDRGHPESLPEGAVPPDVEISSLDQLLPLLG